MHRYYPIWSGKWYKPMSWLNKNQNHLLWCQNDVVLSFVERVNQGESLVNWLNWITEPPAVCWSVIMGDLLPICKGIYWTSPEAFRTKDHQAVLCKAWKGHELMALPWSWWIAIACYGHKCQQKDIWHNVTYTVPLWSYKLEIYALYVCTAYHMPKTCIGLWESCVPSGPARLLSQTAQEEPACSLGLWCGWGSVCSFWCSIQLLCINSMSVLM